MIGVEQTGVFRRAPLELSVEALVFGHASGRPVVLRARPTRVCASTHFKIGIIQKWSGLAFGESVQGRLDVHAVHPQRRHVQVQAHPDVFRPRHLFHRINKLEFFVFGNTCQGKTKQIRVASAMEPVSVPGRV